MAASAHYGIPGQADVFYVDQTGTVVAFWAVDGAWNGPAALTVARIAPPGATLAMTQHQGIDNQTDVFFVDQTGSIAELWVVGDGPWNGPERLTGPSLANPNARLTANSRYGVAGETNVVFIDRSGRANVLSASGTQPWQGPTVVGC